MTLIKIVFASECAPYGTTFQELQDNYLSFNSDDIIGGITDPVECMNLCTTESSYICRVAELYHPNSYCLLYSDETLAANPITFNPSVSYDHYMRVYEGMNLPRPPHRPLYSSANR